MKYTYVHCVRFFYMAVSFYLCISKLLHLLYAKKYFNYKWFSMQTVSKYLKISWIEIFIKLYLFLNRQLTTTTYMCLQNA